MTDDTPQDNRDLPQELAGKLEPAWLAAVARRYRRAGIAVPPGDDAAVVEASEGKWVYTADLLAEGVHFETPGPDDLPRIGQKAIGVNLSDLAAMGAAPRGCLVTVALPDRFGRPELERLYEGIDRMSQYGLEVWGGDTNTWSGGLVLSVTAIGQIARGRAWCRSGGRAGDRLLVTGTLGGSRLGRHWCPTPRVRAALAIRDRADVHAAVDISDGLALDAWRLAHSSGLGAVLWADAIPIASEAHQLARRTAHPTPPEHALFDGEDFEAGMDASSGVPAHVLEHALFDGEDFELLIAVSPEDAAALVENPPEDGGLTPIGTLVAEPGLWLETKGRRVPLPPRGYVHQSKGQRTPPGA